MPAQLSIGLTSASLITMLAPSSTKTITINYKNKIEELQTINNQLVVRLTAHNRRSFSVNYANLTKAQLDVLLGYCNGTLPLWVRLEDNSNIIYDAASYIIVDNLETTVNTSTYLYDLKLEIKQLF